MPTFIRAATEAKLLKISRKKNFLFINSEVYCLNVLWFAINKPNITSSKCDDSLKKTFSKLSHNFSDQNHFWAVAGFHLITFSVEVLLLSSFGFLRNFFFSTEFKRKLLKKNGHCLEAKQKNWQTTWRYC